MSTFRYQLTEDQYRRFIDDPNTTAEIDNIGRLLGVDVKDGPEKGLTWEFSGRCDGTARLVTISPFHGHGIVIEVIRKPWWLFDWFLDFGFRKALK